MKIKTIKVGFLQTNCYVIEKNDECLIIDPGDEANKIISSINKNVVGILVTHYHFDHISAIEYIKNQYKCKIYDINNLKEGINKIKNFSIEVIYTPGHTKDSISFLINYNLFCGDFIFKSSIGRTDLPSGDYKEMQSSIKKILKYNNDIIIYPGHGDKTTLKNEINNLKRYL